MPRVSAAALALIGPGGVETLRRPAPPAELTDEQSEEWRAVVNRMSASHFPREVHALLVQHCRLVTRSRRVAELLNTIENANEVDVKEYRELLRTEEGISRALASIATKLRITTTSTVRAGTERPVSDTAVRKPWQWRPPKG